MEFVNYRFYVNDDIHRLHNFTILDCDYMILSNCIDNSSIELKASSEGLELKHRLYSIILKNSSDISIDIRLDIIDDNKMQCRVDNNFSAEKTSVFDIIESIGDGKCYTVLYNHMLYDIRVTVSDNILRLERIKINKQKESRYTLIDNLTLKNKEKLSSVCINNILKIDFNSDNLSVIANKLRELGIDYNVELTEINVCGHDIDVPCIVLKSNDFEIIFDNFKPLKVIINENYFDTSYLVSSAESKISIHNVVRHYINIEKDSSKYLICENASDSKHIIIKDKNNNLRYEVGYTL